MMGKWRCRLRQTFFGLSDDYIRDVYEQFFLLKYFGGWSFIEAYNLPVKVRLWFLDRLAKQIEKENQEHKNAQSKNKPKRRK